MHQQATIDPKRRYLCRHIFTDGHRCGSPAIRRQNFCFYHRAARPAVSMNGRPSYFPMPLIGDRAAIQNAIFEILNRASSGDIQYREAATLLYGLQLASNNLNRIETAIPTTEPLVEETIMDPEGGYMAPITELPDQPATELPDQPATPPAPIGSNCHSEPKAKNPRISPEPPQHPVPNSSLSNCHSEPSPSTCHSEPKAKNPRISLESPQHPVPNFSLPTCHPEPSPSTCHSEPKAKNPRIPSEPPQPLVPPPQPTTLAAIHACRTRDKIEPHDPDTRMAPRRRQLPRPNQAPL